MWKILLIAYWASVLLVVSESIAVHPIETGDTGSTSPTGSTRETLPTENTPSCPENEIYSNCSNALCRAQKCQEKGLPVACASVSRCDKSCVCQEGFLRNSKGVCVAEDQCDVGPTCPENQIYSNCSNAICRHQECTQRGQPVGCPAVSSCDKGCVCDVGFLRNSNGNCVKEDECDVGPSCPENQVYSNCSNAICRHQECSQRGLAVVCPAVSSCDKGCVCDEGFLRNTNGNCVKEDECDVPPSCPENQVYSNCSNAICRHQECSQRGLPVGCPAVSSCDKGCICDEGFLRNSNGNCVKEDECDVPPSCPENQIYSNCSNAICRHQECTQRGLPVGCPAVSSCDKGCVCDEGFLRNSNGNCVKEDECDVPPSCPENQVYSNCSNAICRHQECSQRGLPVGCPAVSSCDKGCVCDEGFLRNSNGNCVKEDECDVPPSCPENQIYSNCSNAICRHQECTQRGLPVGCPAVSSCDKGCVCDEGFLRNSNGNCVKEDECDVPPSCPENQVYSNCSNAICRHQECSQRGLPVGCPAVSSCDKGCVCDEGFLRNSNGNCVKEDECDVPPSCPENQIYSNCSNAICRHQECTQRGLPVGCPAVSSCDKGCVCDEGFLRNSNGNCVKEDECDVPPSCPENQVYSNCSNAICRHQECSQRGLPVGCPAVSSCDKGCVCDEGFLRNSNGNCVKEDECDVPPSCPENQIYSNCSNAICRHQECTQRGLPVGCPAVSSCDKGCVCDEGFLRNSNGNCVKEDECDVPPSCPENQVYSNCSNAICRHQECSQRGLPVGCPAVSSCDKGCVCDEGFLRNSNGNCVKEDECDVPPSCPENQIYSNCSNAICRHQECTQRGLPVGCPAVSSCDKGCVCDEGFLRNSNGNCVKEDECDVPPSCPENQVYSNCSNAICRHQECSQRGLPVGCPAVSSCDKGCVCDEGFLRNSNGNCVKEDECDVPPSCPENQIYSNCSNAICRHQECTQRGLPVGCPAVSSCDKGCVCDEGFLRNSNGNCVKEDECDVPPSCPENQVYSNCSNAICRHQECSQRGLPVGCPAVSSCDKGCVCDEGFLRNSNGNCVKEDECDVPPSCPENQIYSNCSNAICRHQECTQRGLPVGCPAVSSCDKGCVCDEGFLRNSNGNCVKEDECDVPPSCPENQVYSNCSNAVCRHQECSQRGLPVGCPAVSSCDKGCVCDEGFLRNTNGNCVKEDECDDISVPPSCPENQVYSNCSNALCRAQFCEQRGVPQACPGVTSCDKTCVCAVGFLKNSKGLCVKEDDCDVPPKCPENQVFSTCSNALCRHQECYQKGQPVSCPGMVAGSCRTGCVCDVGYLRNNNGNCVKEQECD